MFSKGMRFAGSVDDSAPPGTFAYQFTPDPKAEGTGRTAPGVASVIALWNPKQSAEVTLPIGGSKATLVNTVGEPHVLEVRNGKSNLGCRPGKRCASRNTLDFDALAAAGNSWLSFPRPGADVFDAEGGRQIIVVGHGKPSVARPRSRVQRSRGVIAIALLLEFRRHRFLTHGEMQAPLAHRYVRGIEVSPWRNRPEAVRNHPAALND